MALDTYANLQTSILKWLDKSDTSTTNYVPDMIKMAEAYFNRRLRVRDMEAVANSGSTTVTSGVASLPNDFRALISVRETGNERFQIKPKPMDQIELYDDDSTGKLQFYDVLGGEVHFWPRVTTSVRLRYLQAIPALSDSNTSNWLLEKHPDAYLYQALSCGEAFNTNDERVPMWKAMAEQALAQIELEDVHLHQDALTPTASVGIAI